MLGLTRLLQLASPTLPVGAYDFANLRASFNFGKQRPVAGNLSVEQGTFYDGHKTTVAVSGGRVSFSTRLSIEPSSHAATDARRASCVRKQQPGRLGPLLLVAQRNTRVRRLVVPLGVNAVVEALMIL